MLRTELRYLTRRAERRDSRLRFNSSASVAVLAGERARGHEHSDATPAWRRCESVPNHAWPRFRDERTATSSSMSWTEDVDERHGREPPDGVECAIWYACSACVPIHFGHYGKVGRFELARCSGDSVQPAVCDAASDYVRRAGCVVCGLRHVTALKLTVQPAVCDAASDLCAGCVVCGLRSLLRLLGLGTL